MDFSSRAFIFPVLWPLGTTAPVHKTPRVTQGLIWVNVALFIAACVNPQALERMFGLSYPGSLYQYLTYSFIHVSPFQDVPTFAMNGFHLFFNVYFLYIFGPPVENRVGAPRMLVFYALFAVAAGVAHNAFQGMPGNPLIGASGAVYGVIGAFMMLFPFASVRCFFCLLIVVVPVVIRFPLVMGFFFIFIKWGLDWLLMILSTLIRHDAMDVFLTLGGSYSAHLAGLAAGVGLIAAVYGFHAFSARAEEDRQKEKRLERHLGKKISELRLKASGMAEANELGDSRNVTPEDPTLYILHEAVVGGRTEEARDRYAELLAINPKACLNSSPQLDLARLLMELNEHDLATQALERLIERFPRSEIAETAHLELGRLLVERGVNPDRAAQLLEAYLLSGPPIDLEREAKRLLSRVTGKDTEEDLLTIAAPPHESSEPDEVAQEGDSSAEPAAARPTEMFDDPGDPDAHQVEVVYPTSEPVRSRAEVDAGQQLVDDIAVDQAGLYTDMDSSAIRPVRPSDTASLLRNSDELFNPEWEKGMGNVNRPTESAPPRPDRDEETGGDSLLVLFPEDDEGDADDDRMDQGRQSEEPTALFPPLEDGPVQIAEQEVQKPADAWNEGAQSEKDSEDVGADEKPAFNDSQFVQITGWDEPLTEVEEDNEKEEVEEEEEEGHTTSPEEYTRGVESSRFDVDRARIYAADTEYELIPEGRYALILAPGHPVDLEIIHAVMRPVMGMSPQGTRHAILRRRGILAENLNLIEAESIAHQLANHKQSIMVVLQHAFKEEGTPLDVLSMRDEGRQVRFSTADQVITCQWRRAICLGAGMVCLGPSAPPRGVLDIIFKGPFHHLRIWEKSFMFEKSPGISEEDRFRALAQRIAEKASQAIHTRTLNEWMKDETSEPTIQFSSHIEYANFVRWYVMAHFAPSQLIKPEV